MSELARTLLALPARLARGLWHFVSPPRTVGRIPLARTLLALQAIAAAVFVGYTLAKKDVRFPFSADPYMVEVILPDAKGLDPAKEPAVGVAGVPVGRITEVSVEEGQARVEMRLDPELRGRVFADATAFLRPTTVLQTLMVNISPGTPEAGPLEEGTPIPASRTGAFVHIDELTGILDADTQAHVQVLVGEAAAALRGREPELRRILAELGRLTDGATPLAEALADRRRHLARLTRNLDRLFEVLGERGAQLAAAVELASRTLEVTAGREPELARAVRLLAPALTETRRALAATRGLAEPLLPALDELGPVARELGPAATGLRELAPELERFTDTAEGLVEEASRPVALLSRGLAGLEERIRGDQIPALEELVDLVELLDEYRYGMIQFAEGWSGAASTNRRAGTYAQQALINTEIDPAGFGFGADAARAPARRGGAGGAPPTRLGLALAEMLERTCREDQPEACLLRFGIPGLPPEPLLGAASRDRGEGAADPAGEGR